MSNTRRTLAAEFVGTHVLVFAGTGAIAFGVPHVGVALTFGLVVAAMAYAVGGVSGAHLNPAVSVGLAAAGKFPWAGVPGHVAAQLAGAFTASALLAALAPDSTSLGATLPTAGVLPSFILEVWLTAVLMYVILAVIAAKSEVRALGGLIVGGVVGLEAMFAGPMCGASMNPARSLAPAIVSGRVEHLWLYLIAPTLGALLAVPICLGSQNPGCCRGRCPEVTP